MRKVLLPLLASLAIATPAMANEARIEARGGVIWANGTSEDVWGAAAGYDFDLGDTAFAGVEVSGDKIGTTGTKVSWGFAGRLGAKVGEQGKLYGVAGYNTENCSSCNDDAFSAGAGYQQGLGKSFYVKGEYRHFFTSNGLPDADAVVAGVGMRF
ncbi:MAG TPA: outer membrane beta-barrel protein [Novosphingobium sp.]|nr:outer membrane beta-barrel protein [Novosphingobium sp.]